MSSTVTPDLAGPARDLQRLTLRVSHGRRWIGFAAYAVVLVVASLWLDGTAALVDSAVGGLGFVPLNLGTIYWLWRASRNPAHSDGERAGLRWLAGMFVLTALGNLSYAFQDLVLHVPPIFGWTNAPYLLSYAVGAYAVAQFPIAPNGAVELRKVLLDIACVVIAIAVVVWTCVVASASWQLRPSELALSLAYPAGCIVLLAFVGRLLMRQAANQQHGDFALLGLALFIQCTVDLLLQLDFLTAGSRLSSWSAAVCPAAYVMIIFAAERSTRRTESGPRDAPDPSLNPINLLPTIASVTVYAVLIWAARSEPHQPIGALVGAAITLNVIFLAKQAIAVRENARLLEARAEAESRERYERLLRDGQKLEAIGRLAGGIAHDFNNLLTTVLANAEFALTRLRPGDAAHEEVSDIRSAAMRGADLIRQLLAFSRKSVVAPVRLQPELVLRDMERLLQRLAGERCGLLLQLPADIGMVHMDRGQLEQVLANLVTNARDAMPDGGAIVISGRNVTLDAARAEPLAVPPGDYVVLAVQDSGVGIPSEVRGQIFEPFFSTKARGKGTGLGLASTYGIMRQSHGVIDVQSEPGVGSVFTLYLPRVTVDAGPRPPALVAMSDAPPGNRGETILLVEDEVAVRQVTRRMLMAEGYRVLTAGDAVAARAMFEQHGHEIALLISDVMMPGESGTALVAQLRQRWPALAVIFISGYSNSELPDTGTVDAGDDFVQKPFTGAQLLARVQARLDLTRRPIPSGAQTP